MKFVLYALAFVGAVSLIGLLFHALITIAIILAAGALIAGVAVMVLGGRDDRKQLP
jgi:hypothetical protein